MTATISSTPIVVEPNAYHDGYVVKGYEGRTAADAVRYMLRNYTAIDPASPALLDGQLTTLAAILDPTPWRDRLTTDQATSVIAHVYAYGMGSGLTAREIARAQLYRLDDVDADRLAHLAYSAHEHGRNWRWQAAERCLDDAYRLLGAENPGTGYAWHAGEHPVQIAAAALAEDSMD